MFHLSISNKSQDIFLMFNFVERDLNTKTYEMEHDSGNDSTSVFPTSGLYLCIVNMK